MSRRRDLRGLPGYGQPRTCTDCGLKGRQGVDFSPVRHNANGTTDWHARCRACHWKHLQLLEKRKLEGVPPDDSTVTFLHDPTGLFTGRSFKFLTFRLSLEKGYWDPGLEVKVGRTKYRIVGEELTPQRLEVV